MCTVTALLYILNLWFRYHYILFIDKCLGKILKKQSFFAYNYFGYFIIESIISLLHPNIFCKNKTFKTNELIFRANVKYYVNDFLLLICLSRSYVLMRFSIDVFKFYSPRMSRIAKLNGANLNRLFLTKCLISKYPFTFLVIFTFIPLFTAAYMIRITETPTYQRYIITNPDDSSSDFEYELNNNDYTSIVNCIWNIMVTMTTVGYGDYYPTSVLGKLICVLMSIWGICINSFMLVIFQNFFLSMSYNEEEAFAEKEKNHLIHLYKKSSMQLLISGLNYVKAKKKYIRSLKGKYPKKMINEFKSNLEDALYNKIEKRRKFKEIRQLYKNTYEFYKDEEILKDKLNKFQNMLIAIESNSNELNNLIEVTNYALDTIELSHNQE
jgi:potassium intermediate/small conductance calcium-activated channel subfamily N protein 2